MEAIKSVKTEPMSQCQMEAEISSIKDQLFQIRKDIYRDSDEEIRRAKAILAVARGQRQDRWREIINNVKILTKELLP